MIVGVFSVWWRGHRDWVSWNVWKPSADNQHEGIEKERMRIMTCINWQRYLTISATILKQHFYCSTMKFQVKMLQLLKWRIGTDSSILLLSKYAINICFVTWSLVIIMIITRRREISVRSLTWWHSDIFFASLERDGALPSELGPGVAQGSWSNSDRGLESLCPDDDLFSDVFLRIQIWTMNSSNLDHDSPLFWFCTLAKMRHQELGTLGTSGRVKEYSQRQQQKVIYRISN